MNYTEYDEAYDFVNNYPRLNDFIKKCVIRLRFRNLSPAEVRTVLIIKRVEQRRARAS